MKKFTQSRPQNIRNAALVATALIFAVANNAMADGTPSGTSVGNIATINYSVDGTAQPEVGSTEAGNTSGPGAETTFLVGTTINLTLIETNTNFTSVAAGSLQQATSFTLTNLGNDSQGYNLTAANSSLAAFTQSDAFDVGTFAYYIDDNNDGLLDANDILITSVDSLAPDASIDLLVTATIPVSELDTAQSTISLTAVTTTNNTTVAVIETTGAYDSTVIQIVFSDPLTTANGTDPGQTEGDASAVALDAYRVLTAALTVSKTTAVYSDPANGTVNPKAIPGAIITYTITIVNNGSGTATGISITDIVDEITTDTVAFNTLYNDGSTICTAEGIAVKDGSEASALCKTNLADTDSADFTSITATATDLTLAGGETATMAFQVTIQ
ncbi:MAG: putative repeat protein (TIGR01451 family) [Glaciecola sp.]|jgi:uncharacterized repeat protein (TIGR01451 family)